MLNSFLAFLLPVLLHCGLLESLTVRSFRYIHTHSPYTLQPRRPPFLNHQHNPLLSTQNKHTQAFAIGPHTDPSHGRAGTLLVDIVRTLPLTLPEPQWLSLVSMPALVRICEAAQQAGATAVGTAAVDAQLLANRGADLMRRLCRAGLPAAAPMGQRRREDGGGGGVGALGVESLAGVYPGLSDPCTDGANGVCFFMCVYACMHAVG